MDMDLTLSSSVLFFYKMGVFVQIRLPSFKFEERMGIVSKAEYLYSQIHV